MKFTFAPESRPLAGFTIKRALYRGGFGEVYYAVSDAGREVALKLLQHNTDVEIRGVQQCLNLSHPNLITIFDILTDRDGDRWIVMEYISGPTLENTLTANPSGLQIDLVRKWISGLAAGMDFLHQRGLIHRDLKPANLFLQNGVVKIGDVGLTKFITQSCRSPQTEGVGTVYYMAPEVANGNYGREVDVYAAGVILYEMLTGELPFDGESTGEILMKHLTAEPDLSRIPPAVRNVVGKALEKSFERRYSSIGELGLAFEAAVATGGGDEAKRSNRPSWYVASNDFLVNKRHRSLAHEEVGRAKMAPGSSVKSAQKQFERSAQTSLPSWGQKWSRRQLFALGFAAFLLMALLTFVMQRGQHPVQLSWFSLLVGAGVIVAVGKLSASPIFGLRKQLPNRNPGPVVQRTAENRQVSGRRSTSEHRHRLAGILGMAALIAPTAFPLTWLLVFFQPPMFMMERGTVTQPEIVALFMTGAVVAGWGVTLIRWMQANSPHARISRTATGFVGIVVGIIISLVDQSMFVDLLTTGPNLAKGAIQKIGDYHLIADGEGPTVLGYSLFFGALFAGRNWARMTAPSRPARFSWGSVLMTLILVWLITLVFAFPLPWALAWGAVISCSVQLASPWVSPSGKAGIPVRRSD